MKKFIDYLKNVQAEMAKVSWPNRQEVFSATVLVIILSVSMSLVVKLFDWVLNQGLNFLLQL